MKSMRRPLCYRSSRRPLQATQIRSRIRQLFFVLQHAHSHLYYPVPDQLLCGWKHECWVWRPIGSRLLFSFCSPTLSLLFPAAESCHDFVVRCKGCSENIPAPVTTLPASWIAARCPLCGEHRRYLPSEVFQGRLSHQLMRKPVRTADGRSR